MVVVVVVVVENRTVVAKSVVVAGFDLMALAVEVYGCDVCEADSR